MTNNLENITTALVYTPLGILELIKRKVNEIVKTILLRLLWLLMASLVK